MPAQQGQLKTGQDGKGLLGFHLWCPDDLPRIWNRIEETTIIAGAMALFQLHYFETT